MGLVALLTSTEVHQRATAQLGLDPRDVDLDTPEAIACQLRRAASFAAPCTRLALKRMVLTALQHLVADTQLPERLNDCIDDLISCGDLVEVAVVDDPTQAPSILLHLGASQFVTLNDTTTFLLGIEPDAGTLLPDSLSTQIIYDRHIRKLIGLGTSIGAQLREFGFAETPKTLWMERPPNQHPDAVILEYDARLYRSTRAGDVAELEVIRPDTPVTFYVGRWNSPAQVTGNVVGRRPQRFGADLWCYVQLELGMPIRVLDLGRGATAGSDEAWRLQSALDARAGTPQVYSLQQDTSRGTALLNLYSPIPTWAQRRLDSVGERVDRHGGSLITYRLNIADSDSEAQFLQDALWLRERSGGH